MNTRSLWKIEAVLFDLDGTLVDIRGPFYESARYAFEQMGIAERLTQARYYELLDQHGLSLGIPERDRRRYAHLALGHFVQRLETELQPELLPGVIEALEELKRDGYLTGVVTSRPGDPQALARKLESLSLGKFFDVILTSPVATLKALDKTENLILASKRIGVEPSRCAYVGDEPRDVRAARAARFATAIAVATGAAGYDHLRTHPEARPDFVLRSMRELPALLTALEKGCWSPTSDT